jgi:hypothetical protein
MWIVRNKTEFQSGSYADLTVERIRDVYPDLHHFDLTYHPDADPDSEFDVDPDFFFMRMQTRI